MKRIVLAMLVVVATLAAAGWARLHAAEALLDRATSVTEAHARLGGEAALAEKASEHFTPGPCTIRERADLDVNAMLCRPSAEQEASAAPAALELRVDRTSGPARITVPTQGFVTADLAIADGAVVAGWFGSEEAGPQRLRVVCLDTASGAVSFDGVVYEQRWGMLDLALGYSRASRTLYFAWKDISTKENRGRLVLGELPLGELGRHQMMTREVFADDSWEKNDPRFLSSGDDLALTVVTGQNWGVASYSGRRALAIGFVGAPGTRLDYRMLATKGDLLGVQGVGAGRTIVFRGGDRQLRVIAYADALPVGA